MAGKSLRLSHTLSEGRQVVADTDGIRRTISRCPPNSTVLRLASKLVCFCRDLDGHTMPGKAECSLYPNGKRACSMTLTDLSLFIASGYANALRPGRALKSSDESSKPSGEHDAI